MCHPLCGQNLFDSMVGMFVMKYLACTSPKHMKKESL